MTCWDSGFLLLWVFRSRLKLHQFKTILSFLPAYSFLVWSKDLRKEVISLLRGNTKDWGQKTARTELSMYHLDCEWWWTWNSCQHLPAHGLFTWAASERFCSPENVLWKNECKTEGRMRAEPGSGPSLCYWQPPHENVIAGCPWLGVLRQKFPTAL